MTPATARAQEQSEAEGFAAWFTRVVTRVEPKVRAEHFVCAGYGSQARPGYPIVTSVRGAEKNSTNG